MDCRRSPTLVAGGSVTVGVVDDGIKGEVIVSIGQLDGVDAPTVTVTESQEGLEAANIGISAGVVDITGDDDGINASGNGGTGPDRGTEYVEQDEMADTGERLEITGGTVMVVAGFDGLDSNGSLTISGGSVDITAVQRGGEDRSTPTAASMWPKGRNRERFGLGSVDSRHARRARRHGRTPGWRHGPGDPASAPSGMPARPHPPPGDP